MEQNDTQVKSTNGGTLLGYNQTAWLGNAEKSIKASFNLLDVSKSFINGIKESRLEQYRSLIWYCMIWRVRDQRCRAGVKACTLPLFYLSGNSVVNNLSQLATTYIRSHRHAPFLSLILEYTRGIPGNAKNDFRSYLLTYDNR